MAQNLRTEQQLWEQYQVEKELARKLRQAPKEERRGLYASLYDELYRRISHHPQVIRKQASQELPENVIKQRKFLRPFLNQKTIFLEVGAGDCALSLEIAKSVKQAYAVEVSEMITKDLHKPPNFELVLSDGCSIPVPPDHVTLAYSHHLMEHLHPDDAFEQLRNIYTALVDRGVYLCITPNRMNGPHDISRYFDTEATGFHLKEYTITELKRLLRRVGFRKIKMLALIRGKYHIFPLFLSSFTELLLRMLPPGLSRKVAAKFPLKLLLAIRLVAIK